MVALGVLSSAAFAGTGTKAPKENLEKKVVESKSSLKAVEEIRETKVGANINCTYQLRVYRGGEYSYTYTEHYVVSPGSTYSSCNEFFNAMRKHYGRQFPISPGLVTNN